MYTLHPPPCMYVLVSFKCSVPHLPFPPPLLSRCLFPSPLWLIIFPLFVLLRKYSSFRMLLTMKSLSMNAFICSTYWWPNKSLAFGYQRWLIDCVPGFKKETIQLTLGHTASKHGCQSLELKFSTCPLLWKTYFPPSFSFIACKLGP